MATVGENILVITAAVIGSLLFLAALERVWPSEKRRTPNDLIGWQLSILGTTDAVILGFMLYTVWTTYSQADLNVDIEADTVMRIYSLAGGLAEPQRTQLQTMARSYADAAIRREWPQMAQGEVPEETATINSAMWKTVMSVKPGSPSEITVQDHLISELDSLTQHRQTRLLQSTTRLPTVLWCVLLVGGCPHDRLGVHVWCGKLEAAGAADFCLVFPRFPIFGGDLGYPSSLPRSNPRWRPRFSEG
jgi:Protein of unknown function (DUF4239)